MLRQAAPYSSSSLFVQCAQPLLVSNKFCLFFFLLIFCLFFLFLFLFNLCVAAVKTNFFPHLIDYDEEKDFAQRAKASINLSTTPFLSYFFFSFFSFSFSLVFLLFN